MKRLTVLLAACILISGCAGFSTTQTEKIDADGSRTISTKVSARTLFNAKSDLAKFKAMQSDKTQSTTVGNLGQESSGTNAVQMLDALARIVGALPK